MRHSRRPGIRWYRYAAPRYYCPTCNAELRQVRRPLGRVINILMVVTSGAYILAFFLHPATLLRAGSLAIVGLFLVVLPFAICYTVWGVEYVLISQEHGDE